MRKFFFHFALYAMFLELCFAAQPQQPKKIPRVGFLTLIPNPDSLELIFLHSLHELGYDEGRNITIEYRRAAGKGESLPQLPEELVQLAVVGKFEELEAAFSTMNRERAEALIIQPLFISNLGQDPKIADLALKNRLPTIYDGGGFYGPDQKPMFQRAATFVDKILKGTKPGDLPVEQPIKFEFIINLKAAKQISLRIPPNVLARADRVIK
jgi:ABC-type uncharacterized transport system substrate-binding protein